MKHSLCIALAFSAVVVASACHGDWFEVPVSRTPPAGPDNGSSATPPAANPNVKLPERLHDAEVSLAEHAVYFAFKDLGIGADKMAAVVARLAQTPSVAKLAPDKAFLIGGRVYQRIAGELDRLAVPARAAAVTGLGDLADKKMALQARLAPSEALRLEQAIATARQAVLKQGVRLKFSEWLEEAVTAASK